jgi:hypothetical protein
MFTLFSSPIDILYYIIQPSGLIAVILTKIVAGERQGVVMLMEAIG